MVGGVTALQIKVCALSQKAPSPISLTLSGIVTVFNAGQSAKAQFSMLSTLLGMVTEVNPLHL